MAKLRAKAMVLVQADESIQQRFDLLVSVPGIAQVSALQLLGELTPLSKDLSVRQWVTHSGLDPAPEISGSSVHRPSRISRAGNRHLRRVQLAMRQNGIRAHGKRRFRVATTDSNHALPIAPNLLARNFTVARANTVWVGDMTYIPTGEGWLYLAVVLDLFSRRIVGWSMGGTITAELACRRLDMAW